MEWTIQLVCGCGDMLSAFEASHVKHRSNSNLVDMSSD